MTLFSLQIQAIHKKFWIQPISGNDGLYQEFEKTYGEHTLYVDPHGLNYWDL